MLIHAIRTVGFEAYYSGVDIGVLTASNLDLVPLGTSMEHLSGRLVPQSGSALDTVGDLFSRFLAGQNTVRVVCSLLLTSMSNG